MSSEELKPCPFCGGEAKEDWGGTAEFYGHEHQTVTIECASCGVSLSIDTSCGKDGLASRGYEFACSCCNDTGAVARKRWNTRARLAAIQGGMGEVIEPCADLRAISSEVKRYTRCGMSIVEDKKGGWVEYSDYAALEAENARLAEDVKKWQALAQNVETLERITESAEARRAQHPDDVAVDHFAAAMKSKLAKSREKGRHGWQAASAAHLSSLLYRHMYKADPLDVANLAMMLYQNGQAIELPFEARTPAEQQSAPGQEGGL